MRDFRARAKTAAWAVPIPVAVHLALAGGCLWWVLAQLDDPAQRGGWGPLAALLGGIFIAAPAIACSGVVALAAVAGLAATRLRSAVLIGILGTLIGITGTAVALGLLIVAKRVLPS